MSNFSFYLPTRIEFGEGVLANAAEEVKGLGGSKVLLVTDKGVMDNDLATPVIDSLKKANLKVTIFDDVKSNPRM